MRSPASHRHARAGNRRHAGQLLGVVLVVAAGATLATGPANARESATQPPADAAAAAASDSWSATTDPSVDPTDAFGRMLADARQRAVLVARAERARELAELRERRAKLAAKRAHQRALRVRHSRASLHSAVVRPVDYGYHLTARFDDGGSLWGSGRHTGLDFACSTGTPVHVVADGVVVRSGYDGAYGNRLEVQHADGSVTTYSHLSAILVHGGRVHAGEMIGRVGSTGNTTGAHLHFEVVRGGEYVDPETWLQARYVTY